ncbi:protein O-mannosyl-transferase 1-like [Anneissia japonica]|uniref:protein O-mannosyl-transferase 1-like n=1 Tax=Anneissia japonica TaxID=1529436 RepID=UPI0014254B6B|nr:protein O-mannosyl-transferase 1-like [Anneissia japonica]
MQEPTKEENPERNEGTANAISRRSMFCSDPFMTVKVNLVLACLTILAGFLRIVGIENPRGVVFDEVHFGQFTSLYINRIFFFDVHPPLGKLLLALSAYLSGFQGNFLFDKIGEEFPPTIPLWYLRLLPAIFGSLLVPAVYQLVLAIGFSHGAATLAGFLVLFENSLIIQSRFMFIDSMLLFFSVLSVLSLLMFKQQKHRPFSLAWLFWLTCTGVSMVCCMSVKYNGIFTVLIVMASVCLDLWRLIADRSVELRQLLYQFSCHVGLLIVLPVIIYISIFFVHLTVLNRSGPHDDWMTSAFQASLQGGLSSITKGQPLGIAFGSQITLRPTHGRTCWLHSHAHTYPMRYPDGRGSSAQQQVTCYSFKDVNNWWLVKDPQSTSLIVDSKPRVIKHGDVIQLVHGISGRTLNSHDVAAPMSPYCMEVSCYVYYNISHPAQNLWKVDIVNRETEGSIWKTIKSHIRLVHMNTSCAIKISGSQLPDWGFNQFEVAADKVVSQEATIWNVEEHKYTRLYKEVEGEDVEVGPEEGYGIPDKELSMWEKFMELQWKMLAANMDVIKEHEYSSVPLEWLLMERGAAYWMDSQSNAQIYFLGNAVTWWTSTITIPIFATIMLVLVIRWRRQCKDLNNAEWERMLQSSILLFGGWLLHYLPFFIMDRTLFLHHYLSALVFKIILLAVTVEIIYIHVLRSPNLRNVFLSLLAVWCTSVFITYLNFRPLTFGNKSLSMSQLHSLQWLDTWTFLVRNRI